MNRNGGSVSSRMVAQSWPDWWLNWVRNTQIWLESVSEPQSFAVTEETWERFQRCYQDNAQGFFVCETNDGRYIGINLAYVEMARFLWQSPPIQWDKEEPHLWVELHIVNSRGGSFGVDESRELADIFWYLELGDKDEILSFTDIDGEEVMFTPKRLKWCPLIHNQRGQSLYSGRSSGPPRRGSDPPFLSSRTVIRGPAPW